ncbi:threonine ammonia-lyase [Actinomadura luteofluorescens]|uniref:threonine ammonia-lyase n=1 Tax=Actinomadura luteofluorescens TaxID=46163 RepID=UPI0030D4452A
MTSVSGHLNTSRMIHPATRAVSAPTASAVDAALAVVTNTLVASPLMPSPRLAPDAFLKLESLQPTGSFKVRGALAAVAMAERNRGIVTASAGNHGLAVAWAAERLDRHATVVIPRTASSAKANALERSGCKLEHVGENYEEAEEHALTLAAEGHSYISAYNDPNVIAGQSTIGAELAHIDGPITVYVPVGGGGLVAGVCLWAQDRSDVRVVGVESAASRGLSAAIEAGRVVNVPVGRTLADGLAGNLEAGSVTVEIASRRVDEMVAVTEEEIEEAIRFLAAEHGLVAEGSGAVGVAAVMNRRANSVGSPVALVTGRNIALSTLAGVLGDASAQ